MDDRLEFRVLGSLEVVADGRPVRVDAPKQRAVLAVLLVHVNEVLSTDRLMDAVWGDDEVGVGTLRYHVSKLRETLQSEIGSAAETVIATEAPGYVLHVDPNSLDAARFDALVDGARESLQSAPETALRLLDEALELWRGEPYAEFAYEEFAHLEVERLAEKRRGAIEDRMDALLALGRHGDAIAQLEGLTAQEPHRERLWGQLALALYRGGRQSDAVAALQQIRDSLGDLGLDLSPPLKELEQRVFSQDPSLLEEAAKPEQLRGYVLRGIIGEGAHAVVWRAAQPGIGREVALKAIRPELSNQPEFVRRFEAEAQLVASLEHPNIISLYDFWRDPDGAYLVMPYLRGGSLAGVLHQGALDPPQVLEILTAVGSALTHAHRRGVVHRDVTPHNVLLDEDGHPYLADFGMATLLGGTGPSVTSSPAYMSPEESAGTRAVIQSDVYSLGVLVHAALSDRIPVAGESLPAMSDLRHDLPPAVDDVIACATAPDVADRYSSIAAFVDALARAFGVGREDAPVVDTGALNPYKGLRAFEEADAADFFGRELLVSEVAQTVGRRRLVGVVGPSGCGKSSLVKAGVVPLLRRGVLPGSEQWLIADMYPGARPLVELEAALMRVAVERPSELGTALSGAGADLDDVFDQLLPRQSELFLVVDQFEELFTLTTSEEERDRFLAVLSELASDPSLRVRVLITMRADFYDRPLEYPEFGELLRRGLVSVTMPAAEHLREAIAGPARRVGLGVDDALIESIVRDVSGQPGGLPLMEYALTELFERRHGPQLTIEAYRTTAGVMGALGRRAEDLYKRYDETGRDAVRQTFLRLVTVEEGVADTRRRIPLSELRGLEIDGDALDQVLDDYGSHRLLTFDRDPDTREPTVEVAHEALLGRWERLRTWIDDRRDDLSTYRRLAAAAKEWTDSQGADEYLLTGGRLEHYQAFAAETDLFLTASDAEYLAASRKYNADLVSRRRRRRRAIMAGFGAAALIAAVFALRAAGEARRARASELAAYAAQVLDEDPDLSLRLLLESIDTAEPTTETLGSLHEVILNHRLIMERPDLLEDSGVLSPSGDLVFGCGYESCAAVSVPLGVLIWQQEQYPEALVGDGYFSPDGGTFLTLPEPYDDGPTPSDLAGIHSFDIVTGERTIYRIDSPFSVYQLVPNSSGQIDPGLPIIAVAEKEMTDDDPTDTAILRIDLSDGSTEPIKLLDYGALSHGQWTTDRAVTRMALGVSLRTAVLDLETGEITEFGAKSEYGSSESISPDGDLLVTVGRVRSDVWDLESREALWSLPSTQVEGIVFSPDGARLAVGNQIWDSRTGELLLEFPSEAWDLSMSSDGRTVMVGGKVWNAGPNGEVGGIDLPIGGVYEVGVELVGNRGVALNASQALPSGMAYVYELTTTENTVWGEVRLGIGAFGSPALSADGRLLAVQQEPEENHFGPIGIYDAETGALVKTLSGLCVTNNDTLAVSPGCRSFPETPFSGYVWDMVWLPGGQSLAATVGVFPDYKGGHKLIVWDVASGEMLDSGAGYSSIWDLMVDPSGGRLIVHAADGDQSWILDTRTWELVGTIDAFPVSFAPDGSLLVGRYDEESLVLLEGGTWEELSRISIDGECIVWDAQFGPSGATMVAQCWGSGLIVIVDIASGEAIEALVAHTPVKGIKFVGDSHLIVIPEGGPGVVLETDTEQLIELARKRVVAEFTAEECERYGIDPCPAEPEPEEEGELDEEEESEEEDSG